MVGAVYFLSDQDSPFGKHPCVVVLEIRGSRECIIVPGFSTGRDTVEQAIETLVEAGLSRSAVAVTLDNRHHLSLVRRIETYEAHWVTAQWARLPLAVLRKGSHVARMDDEALKRIVAALIELASERPGEFSQPLIRKLRQLYRKVSQEQP